MAAAASADDILSCASFDEARQRHVAVIQLALSVGPPLEVFRANWVPGSQFHDGLRRVIVHAAEKVATSAAPPAGSKPLAVEDVLACASFDEARARFPHVIQKVLQSGPPEDVFRKNWAPGT
eukprot:gene54835-23000_t